MGSVAPLPVCRGKGEGPSEGSDPGRAEADAGRRDRGCPGAALSMGAGRHQEANLQDPGLWRAQGPGGLC